MSCRCSKTKQSETWKFSVHSDANNQRAPEQEKGEMSEWSYSSSASDKIFDQLSAQSQGWWDESSVDVVKVHRRQLSEDEVDLSQLDLTGNTSWGDWSKHSKDCDCDPCNGRKSWVSGPDESAKSDGSDYAGPKVKEFKYSESESSDSSSYEPCRKSKCDPCRKSKCDPCRKSKCDPCRKSKCDPCRKNKCDPCRKSKCDPCHKRHSDSDSSDSSQSYSCDPCHKRKCDPCHDKRPCDPKKPVCVHTVCKYQTKCGFVRVEVQKTSEPATFSGTNETIQYQFKLINTGTDYIAYKAFLIDNQLGLKELCLLQLAPGAFETVTWDYITTEADVNARKITNCAVLYVMVRKKTYLQSPPAKYSIPYVMPPPQ